MPLKTFDPRKRKTPYGKIATVNINNLVKAEPLNFIEAKSFLTKFSIEIIKHL